MHTLKTLADPLWETDTLIFICLGRQTKQIMVAKFQSLMLLIANAESSPLYFPLYVHYRRKIQGKSLRKDGQRQAHLY
jgi:hypothetical protein